MSPRFAWVALCFCEQSQHIFEPCSSYLRHDARCSHLSWQLAPGLNIPSPCAVFPTIEPIRDLPAVTTSLVMRADARIETLEAWITEAEAICHENQTRAEAEITAATEAYDAAVKQVSVGTTRLLGPTMSETSASVVGDG